MPEERLNNRFYLINNNNNNRKRNIVERFVGTNKTGRGNKKHRPIERTICRPFSTIPPYWRSPVIRVFSKSATEPVPVVVRQRHRSNIRRVSTITCTRQLPRKIERYYYSSDPRDEPKWRIASFFRHAGNRTTADYWRTRNTRPPLESRRLLFDRKTFFFFFVIDAYRGRHSGSDQLIARQPIPYVIIIVVGCFFRVGG